MPSNSLPDADFNLPEMKTKSPSCPSGRVHMYDNHAVKHKKTNVKYSQKDLVQNLLEFFCPFIVDFTQKNHF